MSLQWRDPWPGSVSPVRCDAVSVAAVIRPSRAAAIHKRRLRRRVHFGPRISINA